MKKKIGKSDPWLTSRLSHRPSEPAYYIVDCRILILLKQQVYLNLHELSKLNMEFFTHIRLKKQLKCNWTSFLCKGTNVQKTKAAM